MSIEQATKLILDEVNIEQSDNSNKRLSDVITMESIYALNKKYIHLIPAPAGSGKTYFAIERLMKDAWKRGKKVLLLSSRSSLNAQSKADVENAYENFGFGERVINVAKATGTKIETYQSLTVKIMNRKPIPHYDIIICDEAHYFISDASFNFDTVHCFKWLAEQTESLKLFLTATPYVFQFIEHDLQYLFSPQEVGLVSSTQPISINFTRDLTKHITADMFDENGKLIVFTKSIRRARTIAAHLQAEDSVIISKWSKKNADIHNAELVEEIVATNKFSSNILIATMAHNVGLNIRDDIKLIGLSGIYKDSDVIQSINRARDQKVNIIVEKLHKSDVKKAIKRNNTQLEYIELFKQGRFLELESKIDINAVDWTFNVFDEKANDYILNYNPFYEANLKHENAVLSYILEHGEFKYYQKLYPDVKQININERDYEIENMKNTLRNDFLGNRLAEYIINFMGVSMNKAAQETFRNGLHNVDNFGRKDRPPGLRTISKVIEPLGFYIESKRIGTSKDTNWFIEYKY